MSYYCFLECLAPSITVTTLQCIGECFVLFDLRDSICRSVALTSHIDYVINTDDDDADDGPYQHEQHPE